METIRKKTGRSIKIPKSRVRRITNFDLLIHTRCSSKPHVYYFTHGRQIDENCKEVLKQRNPFIKIDFTIGRGRELMKLQKKTRLQPGYLTDTFNSAKYRHLLCRLNVPYDERELKSKLGLTPHFRNIPVGRAVKDHMVKSKLIYYLEDNLRKKIASAIIREQKQVCETRNDMFAIKVASSLKEFPNLCLFEDFMEQKQIELLEIPKFVTEIRKIKNDLLHFIFKLQENLKNIITDLMTLIILRGRIEWCKNLTFYLSPKTWKYDYAEESNNYVSPFIDKIKLLKGTYLKYKFSDADIDETVKTLAALLINDIKTFGPFSLYFTKPLHLQCMLMDIDLQKLPKKLDAYYLTSQINEVNNNIFKINYCVKKQLARINVCKSKLNNMYELSKRKREYYENEIKYYGEKSTKNITGRPEGYIFIKFLFKELYDFVVEYPNNENTPLEYLEAIENQIQAKFLFVEQCWLDRKFIIGAINCVRDKKPTKFDLAEMAYKKRNQGLIFLKSIRNALKPIVRPLVKQLKFRSKISSDESVVLSTYDDEIESEMNYLIQTTEEFRKQMKSKEITHAYQIFDVENVTKNIYKDNSILNLMDLPLINDEVPINEIIDEYLTESEYEDDESSIDICEASENEQFYQDELLKKNYGVSEIQIEQDELSEAAMIFEEDKIPVEEKKIKDEEKVKEVEKFRPYDFSKILPDYRK